MQLLQTVQKNFALVGIDAENVKTHQNPHDKRAAVVLGVFFVNIIFNVVFFIYEAKTFEEILQSCHLIISANYDFTLYILFVLNTVEWIRLVENCEKFVNESERALHTILWTD